MGTYKQISRLVLVAFLSLHVASAQALALSEVELKSHLNQRLDARIELSSVEQDELDNLTINLTYSSPNQVSRYQLKYEILRNDLGNVLKITTSDVVREPVISFTLEIVWSNGHVIREYSLLIDPPRN